MTMSSSLGDKGQFYPIKIQNLRASVIKEERTFDRKDLLRSRFSILSSTCWKKPGWDTIELKYRFSK